MVEVAEGYMHLYKLFQKHDLQNGSMSTRHELTDEQWAVIEPLLPKPKPGPGRPPADPRKTLNGILYVLKTGCTWADMPRQYGSPTTLLAAIEAMVGRRDVGADLARAVKSN